MHKLHIAEELNRHIQLLLGYLRIACGLQQQADKVALINRKDLGVLVMSRVLVYDDQLGALGGFRKGLGGIGEVRYGNGNQRIKLLIRQVVDGPVRIFFGIA